MQIIHINFDFEIWRRELGQSNLTFEKVERTARRHKNNKYPKMPRSPKDIVAAFENEEIYEKYGFNMRKTKPFYVDTVEIGVASFFTIFASYEAIDLIKLHIEPRDRNYLLDGTFKVRPIGGFYQLLIIHIECKNDIIPVIYVLLSGKSSILYQEVFKFIELKIFHLEPSQFMVDFEAGLRAAINASYPDAKLHGCWYHFCAAIRRRFLKLHLYELIKTSPDARFVYRSILSLPLLPPESLLAGYNITKEEAKDIGLGVIFKPVFDYFESYWLALVSNT